MCAWAHVPAGIASVALPMFLPYFLIVPPGGVLDGESEAELDIVDAERRR